jgi:hypothetical protein
MAKRIFSSAIYRSSAPRAGFRFLNRDVSHTGSFQRKNVFCSPFTSLFVATCDNIGQGVNLSQGGIRLKANTDRNSLDKIISGNLVLNDDQAIKGSVGIKDGKIVAVGSRQFLGVAKEELDFGDLLVFPGAVDAHCHSIGYEQEGFTSSTRGAAAGGVTTINDHPLDLGGAPVTAES